MYEIQVIENDCQGFVYSNVTPIADENVETVFAEMVREEEECVAQGILRCYTMLSWYIPNENVPLDYHPAKFVIVETHPLVEHDHDDN